MRVEIIFHSEQLKRQLAALADRIASGKGRHIAQGLIRAARYYMLAMRGRFFRASRHDGTWKDHAPSTKLSRARKLGGGFLQKRTAQSKAPTAKARAIDAVAGLSFPILYDTGRLFRSMSPGGPGYIERFVNPLTIRVGTSVPYAPYHQFGGPNLPQRTILAAPEAAAVKAMEKEIADAVEREIAELNAQLATA